MLPIIILAIEDDDDRAFMTSVYLKYERLMFSEAYKVTKHIQDTEDVMQISLVKLIDKIPLLRTLDRKRLTYYLCRTAKNTAISFCQKERRMNILSMDDDSWAEKYSIAEDEMSIEQKIILKEDFAKLQEVWAELDEKTKYILSERYLFEKSAKEISDDIATTPENVRMMLTRARRKAYKLLEKDRVDHNTWLK